ncbi:cyclic nucleotide-binding domain-containing protein [Marinimicrobium alkaliphilum]|uniref:cyclic nucleotide-binding domain-containing protein n=1 Tax=Marinimicrobium alkaliphilum TaxID=2202654 RepID=UPI000DBA737A|nr:cyclic nucleotide-binding domain-containing protein [Marinimicrobium alkaliphilum]
MSISQSALRALSPFDSLSDEYLAKVGDKVQLREVQKGTLIFQRGKSLTEALYLLEGQVDLIDAKFSTTSVNHKDADLRRHPLTVSVGNPTQMSAVAKSNVKLLCLENDFLDLVMAWSESGNKAEGDEEEHDWMSNLLEAPLFTKIPPGNIQQLFVRFESVEFKKGESVVREGEPGDYFYVLETGRAKVVDKAGATLAELIPGQYFGEEALVGDTTRNATVLMTRAGRLMRLGKEDFKNLLLAPVVRATSLEALQQRDEEQRGYALIDVRLAVERRFGKVANSRNIPLSKLRNALPDLDHNTCYVVTDDAGRRTDVAAQLLAQGGFETLVLQNAREHY